MKRIARITLRILLLAVSIGFALLLAELALRVIGRDSLIDFEPVLRSGPVTYLPNQVARHRFSDEIETTITINSMGLRDVEYGDSQRRCTVVALGDSFTEGWGVDLEQTYVKGFERQLAAGTDGLDNVYNAGLNGRNPKNYITMYREIFQDDESVELVTIGLFLGNDAVVESTPSYIQPPDRTFGYHVKFFLMRHSSLYNMTRRQLRSSTALEELFVALGLTNPREMPPNLYRNARNDASWRYTAELIGEFNASIVDSGKQFLLVLIPPKELVDDDFYRHMLSVTGDDPEDLDLDGFRNTVLEFCSRNELPVLDLTNTFRDASEHPARDFYFKGDDHWNPEGHALAAQAIWEYVQRHDLVPCRQASEERS